MLEVNDLHFSYGQKTILNGVSLSVPDKEIVGLIGTNGSGKTTLLRCLYASLSPQSGSVTLEGKDVTTLTRRSLAKKIAVVVQENISDLPLTVADSVLLGRSPHLGAFSSPGENDLEIATKALEDVGALDLAQRPYGNLSGGEKQRVLIARAIAAQCPYLLMDEPTNHLDIHYQHEVLELVNRLRQTTVVVMHDMNLAAQYCDRLVLLDEGKVCAEGTPPEVLQPEILEPVYGVKIQRIENDQGQIQLLFSHLHPRGNTAQPFAA